MGALPLVIVDSTKEANVMPITVTLIHGDPAHRAGQQRVLANFNLFHSLVSNMKVMAVVGNPKKKGMKIVDWRVQR